jgi:SAM-dependent methyltransferase
MGSSAQLSSPRELEVRRPHEYWCYSELFGFACDLQSLFSHPMGKPVHAADFCRLIRHAVIGICFINQATVSTIKIRKSHWPTFAVDYLCSKSKALSDKLAAARDSLMLEPSIFSDAQFIRFHAYRQLQLRFRNARGLRVIEFGGSNGVVSKLMPHIADYKVAPNYPDVDLHDLSKYTRDYFNIVVIDNVLEHLSDPRKALDEIHSILQVGGLCICLTPFLIRIHGYPDDYWRFTESGLRKLFDRFSHVEVESWGNRFTVATTMQLGWLSVRNSRRLLKAALWNEPEWPVTFLTIAHK